MQRLSNPSALPQASANPAAHDSARAHSPSSVDITDALRLLLGQSGRLATTHTAEAFSQYLVARNLGIGDLALHRAPSGSIDFAALPLPSPGRSALLMIPTRLGRDLASNDPELIALVRGVCDRRFAGGTRLMQALLPTDSHGPADLLVRCGFQLITELVYMQRTVRRVPRRLDLPAGLELLPYQPATHGLFADAIQRSYAGSLDCPELTGRRDIEDVIAGHKAAGDFSPSMWSVLVDRSNGIEPLGVLLLAGMGGPHGGIELVYLALVPEGRGRGLGRLLLRHAEAFAARSASRQLALAVDSRNTPALALYMKHKLKRAQSRLAMVRFAGD